MFPSEVGAPAEQRNVLRRFQKVCADNELPKLRVYNLRHTHASLLINEGVHPKRISERLGYSSIKLTMDTYGHLFEGSDRDSADKMERLFGTSRSLGAPVHAFGAAGAILLVPHSYLNLWLTKNTKARQRRAVNH